MQEVNQVRLLALDRAIQILRSGNKITESVSFRDTDVIKVADTIYAWLIGADDRIPNQDSNLAGKPIELS